MYKRIEQPSTPAVLSVTENGETQCLRTNRYADPLFFTRRCSIASADQSNESMLQKAFPGAEAITPTPELFSMCSTAIDFDRGILSVRECGHWFNLPAHAAFAAADWCYERLEYIPPAKRTLIFYLRIAAECGKRSADHVAL